MEKARRESENLAVNPLTSEGQTTILRNQGRIMALKEIFDSEKLVRTLERTIEHGNKINKDERRGG